MTKKLYYENTWLDNCEAEVLECKKSETGGYEILLDRTVIFPEGGGQPSDTGKIDSLVVSSAFEEGEEIWNCTDAPIEKGKTVKVTLDIDRRRDHSQQHSGEHIISGLANSIFKAKNVGFHMAETYSTLDLDLPLSDDDMKTLELEANIAVQKNMPVSYRFVQAEELSEITLRKQASGLSGEIRIVYVGDADSCTCCGTHCLSTGEIGYIRFVNWQNYKGGVRLWFLCGMRAIQAANVQRDILSALAKRFSAKQEDIIPAIEKQGNDLAAMKHEMKNRTDALLTYRATEAMQNAESVSGIKILINKIDGFSMPDLKIYADKLLALDRCIAVLFAENQDNLQYQLAASKGIKLSMRELCAVVNAATGGKGGGKDDFAQGSAKPQNSFDETIMQIKGYMRAKLKEEC